MKNLENAPFSTENVIYFVVRRLFPSKMAMRPKLFFMVILEKKFINEKYLEPHFLQKRLYVVWNEKTQP